MVDTHKTAFLGKGSGVGVSHQRYGTMNWQEVGLLEPFYPARYAAGAPCVPPQADCIREKSPNAVFESWFYHNHCCSPDPTSCYIWNWLSLSGRRKCPSVLRRRTHRWSMCCFFLQPCSNFLVIPYVIVQKMGRKFLVPLCNIIQTLLKVNGYEEIRRAWKLCCTLREVENLLSSSYLPTTIRLGEA